MAEETTSLVRLAVERGWLTREQAQSGRPLGELLSAGQISELRAGKNLASRLLGQGFLKGDDLKERDPERFGRYEIVKPLGAGGAGRVYLARDPELGRQIAIKILDRGIMAQPERFHREMEILASLRHPNIVAIFDAGTQDGRPFYAMEYAGGKSLAETKLPLREAVQVLEQVARACHAAHEKGIIHRDLKPANILFGDRPLVADFGIAKVTGAELTETGQTLGTPHYMCPEQAAGKAVDARSDVYSLGVMLYEAMTGRRPFAGESAFEVLRKVAEEEPKAPRAIDPSLPRGLEAVAMVAMARDPKKRYATARALADDLRAWLEDRPVQARPPGLVARVTKALRRRPRLTAAIGVAMLVVVIFAVATGPRRRFESAQRILLQEAVRIQGWMINLYQPAKEMSYTELERAVANLRPILYREDLPATLRHEAHAAAGRANLLMGRVEEARVHLDAAIELGAGLKIGEEHFERARITWESLLREKIAKNESEAKRLADEVTSRFRAALKAGFRDDWNRALADTLLKLANQGERSVADSLRALDELAKVPEKRAEEIAKIKGDLYLLMKNPDPDRALEQFQIARNRRECYVQAYNGMALAHLMRGRENAQEIQRAFDAAGRAIEINPRYEDSYFLYMLLCREIFRASPRQLKRNESSARELLERGVAQLRVGIRARQDSIPIRTAHGTACALWAWLLEADVRDPAAAIAEGEESLLKAISLDGRRMDSWLSLGALQFLNGTRLDGKKEALKDAGRSFERARALAPDHPFVLQWLGFQQYESGDRAAAVASWKRAVELHPNLRDELEPEIIDAQRRR